MSGDSSIETREKVVAALRAGGQTVPPSRFDTQAVLASARRALGRRRRRQSVVGAVTVVLLALTLASPVHVPGVGILTMPGGFEFRRALGLESPGVSAPAPGIDLDELVAHVSPKPPSTEKMAGEAASLQRQVLPVVEEFRATWYETGPCDILEYSRGTFSEDGRCGGRPGERRFDDVARADLDQILDAVVRSGVPVEELLSARYAEDGHLLSAGFSRSGGGWRWNYAYLYSPTERPSEWTSPLGPVTVTAIGTAGWWFEKSPDD